jgi:thiamine pyrophosphate-dependent acetolactate synthase large subunit-like protein
MFKISSFEEEIYKSMEKNLVSNQTEDKYNFGKLSKAADLLNAAAELFDKAGMRVEAAEVTKVLSTLAKQLNKKTL